MEFALTESQIAWREEVRSFLAEQVTPEFLDEMWETIDGEVREGPLEARFRKAVADKGWYGLNWPEEYGGLAKSAIEQLILIEEFHLAGAPKLPLTVTSLGPAIIRFGTRRNKESWLPKMIRGEVNFALGYSEPDAGTDLAALTTRARRDGDEWVITGQKIWNSDAHRCTHEWLAVRTDTSAPRHRGLSVIIVPIDLPGIEIAPLWTWSGVRTNVAFFDEVRVPLDHLVGEENKGWEIITAALDFERMALGTSAMLRAVFDDLVELCAGTNSTGGMSLIDDPIVGWRLGQLDADLEVARLLSYRTAAAIDRGAVPTVEAAMSKVMTTELRTKLGDWGMQILGMAGQLDRSDPESPLRGAIEYTYRRAPFLRFGGGANEIQRDIIAERGLGLPRTRRRA